MRDNASEYKSEEMKQFLESRGIRSHFSTPKEQWQNSEAESTINSLMMSA
jgi:transposase InsO family protein